MGWSDYLLGCTFWAKQNRSDGGGSRLLNPIFSHSAKATPRQGKDFPCSE